MKEYQILKTSISSIIENAEPLVDINSVLKDHEETKRSLAKVRANYLNCLIIQIQKKSTFLNNFNDLYSVCSTRR